MLAVDPSNPVIAAIGRGVAAETAGDLAGARLAYAAAWEAATDDFERCVAAHYVPRVIDDAAERLRWNEDALRLALAVGDDRVRGFFASLYACVGECRVKLGDLTGGQEAFRAAVAHLDHVPEGAYKAGLTAMIQTHGTGRSG